MAFLKTPTFLYLTRATSSHSLSRKPSTFPSTLPEKGIQARRERNRRAQHDFRQRRRAAEEAKRRRMQHLEDTIEEISHVLINFCDEMLGTEEIARQPRLMARLQHTTRQALVLARSVSNPTDTSTPRESEDERDNRRDDGPSREKNPHERPSRQPADASVSEVSCQPTSSVVSVDDDPSPTFDLHGDDLNGSGLNDMAPLIEQTWPRSHLNAWHTNSFPVRLVKATLSRASLSLGGDLYVPAEEIERALGPALRLRTRQQLLAYMQWLLGPGSDDLYQATGTNWNTAASVGRTKSYFPSSLPSPEDGSYDTSDTDSSGHSSTQAANPEFLTAIGVQEQLQSLGAKVLSSDTIELSISRPEFPEAGAGSLGSTVPAFLAACAPDPVPSAAALIVQLNTSLLEANLAYVAKCLGKGPVYPRHEIGRAVEASVILARWG
ncbi:hypothetical protein LCI18_014231 [Fusarium solani-melongenae]|uniref:Uncharacterized protein n=1 Tax=Fusarium solani subsp. cucurbitae TaxID=2747967 RepID=A0ACD3ZR39_FUSSC|nr:hypothetical protein LCI18_014231 [Fusarium solani-melongenae]